MLRERISNHDHFTDTFSAEDWDMHAAEVCLLSFDGRTFEYACLGHRGRRVATAKFRAAFSNFVELDMLPITEIQTSIKSSLRAHFTHAVSGLGGRVPEMTWLDTIKAVQTLRPLRTAEINRLLKLRRKTFDYRTENIELQMAQEKDILGVSLDIFDSSGKLRQKTLSHWEEPSDYAPPFMEGLTTVRYYESHMIIHDLRVFPEGLQIPTSTPGLATRFVVGDRKLDLIYANQTDIETALGADLVYYNSRFASYSVVQYKRMYPETLAGKQTNTYRPSRDGSFAKEMERMRDICSRLGYTPEDISHADYRLVGHGFYFKLCPLRFEPNANELIKGMYLPWEFMHSLMVQGAVSGPNDGVVLSFENVPRHFNNTQFTNMVRDGWIGTRGRATTFVTEVIRQSLQGKKAVVVAVESHATDDDKEYTKFTF